MNATAEPKLKPWPRDVVPIIASVAGTEHRDQMVMPVAAECRDCGCGLVADQYTLTTAENLPERQGRPIVFICTVCLSDYNLSHLARPRSKVVDHRGGAGKREWEAMQVDLGGEG